jgi:hypothetical protein
MEMKTNCCRWMTRKPGAATRKTNNYKYNIGLLTIPQPQTATQSNNIATQTMRKLAGTSSVRSLAGWLVD